MASREVGNGNLESYFITSLFVCVCLKDVHFLHKSFEQIHIFSYNILIIEDANAFVSTECADLLKNFMHLKVILQRCESKIYSLSAAIL